MLSTLESLKAVAGASTEDLCRRFSKVRSFSEHLAEPLSPEDMVIQSMPDASPTRWHLAHTTWFFETFVLKRAIPEYESPNPAFEYLFNSYYNQVGPQFPRPGRGLLSRPTVKEVFQYRRLVDERMLELLSSPAAADPGAADVPLQGVIEIGLEHEQQHQELILTDLKHMLSCNPLWPAYRARTNSVAGSVTDVRWVEYEESVRWIGHEGAGFCFDNEQPRHRVFVHAFQLADRPVTNGEFMAFIDDGAYTRPELWLSEGWETVRSQGWKAPLYWRRDNLDWSHFTLAGGKPIEPSEPVCHVSYYEADAFARWAGARLPTEAEWETAAESIPIRGNFSESGLFHPSSAPAEPACRPDRMFGDVWEWTSSPYSAYPGYRPLAGALGEYNGKFMCNQFVLRGGSCATPEAHIRRSYRNFFPPWARWQYSGLRLAKDA